MKSLNQRLRQAGRRLGERRYQTPDYALAMLKMEKAGLMSRGFYTLDQTVAELDDGDAALQRLEQRQARPVQPGLSEHAYLSTVDDSAQPYYIFVPRAHDGKTPRPCIVYLHGYSPDLDKLNWQMLPPALLEQADRHGVYIAVPFARSNTDFQSIGEADVIEVLERVSRDLPVDADRVYLMGYSMGGMGTFTLGAHFPGRWAGIVSLAGRPDYYLWKQLDPAKVEPWKRRLLDLEFGAAARGNFRNTPLLMYHGSADSLVRPEQSRRMHQAMRAMGADATLHILPDEDHWIMNRVLETDGIFQWMNHPDRKLNRWPKRVDFTAYSIKYRRSHWVTVHDLIRWGEPIRVQAELNADRSRLEVTTSNVASLTLDLDEQLVGKAPRLTVRINGQEHPVAKPGPATFEVVPVKPVGKLRKTPTLCGPIKEALTQRFLLVFGSGEAGDKDDLRRLQDDLSRYAGEWYRFTKSMPLWERADRVTDKHLRSANLVLHGSPSDNLLLKRIADKLPIKITDRGFEFQAQTYDRADHGLVMIYPNPLNPERYVVVRSGLPYGERLPENHKYDLLPDFIIFRRGTDYDDTDAAVVAGFFDENWQVAERLLWRRAPDAPAPDPRLPRAEPPAWPEPFPN
jgi:pimeloyl-ACP methyl ester carboxylesterase